MGILSKFQKKQTMPQEGWSKLSGEGDLQFWQTEFPSLLVARLREFFSSSGQVERAYLVVVRDPNSSEPAHKLIGIVMKSGCSKTFREFAPEIGEAIQGATEAGDYGDIMDLSTAGETGALIARSFEPFYP